MPTTSLGEVTQTRAVAVLCELGYHDNVEDVTWLRNNLEAIAANLVQSLCDYFGIPFVKAGPVFNGIVAAGGSNLNIRDYPSTGGQIIGSTPDGARLTIYGDVGNGWYVVHYNGVTGYASSQFIVVG